MISAIASSVRLLEVISGRTVPRTGKDRQTQLKTCSEFFLRGRQTHATGEASCPLFPVGETEQLGTRLPNEPGRRVPRRTIASALHGRGALAKVKPCVPTRLGRCASSPLLRPRWRGLIPSIDRCLTTHLPQSSKWPRRRTQLIVFAIWQKARLWRPFLRGRLARPGARPRS